LVFGALFGDKLKVAKVPQFGGGLPPKTKHMATNNDSVIQVQDSKERVAFDLMKHIEANTSITKPQIQERERYYFELYAECLSLVKGNPLDECGKPKGRELLMA
jgi:hypothetical protein